MDIYQYINSKVIAAHLRTIGYEFSSLEAAWLIWQCKDLSVLEKHTAWEELIRTMPDCEVPARMHGEEFDSIHGFLEEYMELQSRLIFWFYEKKDGWVYRYDVWEDGRWSSEDAIFRSMDKVISHFHDTYAETAQKLLVRKQRLDWPWVSAHAIMLPYHTSTDDLIEISFSIRPDGDELPSVEDVTLDQLNTVYDETFRSMWFDFPLPFKRGDILRVPQAGEAPIVYDGSTFSTPDCPAKEHLQEYGDNTDMALYGYLITDQGKVHRNVWDGIMDCTYYPISY